MTVHLLLHVSVCVGFMALARSFVSERLALLAGALWAWCALDAVTLPTASAALIYWKDDPDMTCSGAILVALWCWTRFFRGGDRRFMWAAFSAQLVAIGIKEMAYVLPFLVLALCWYERAGKRAAAVAATFCLTAAAYAFRWWALQGPGFRFGTNGSWDYRFVLHCLGGRGMALAYQGQSGVLGVACLSIGAVLLARRRWRGGAVLATVGAAGIAWTDLHAPMPWATFNQMIMPFVATFPQAALGFYFDALATGMIVVMFVRLATRRDRRQLLAFAWMLAAYLPLLTAPLTDHALYLTSAFWALFFALGLTDLLRFLPKPAAFAKAAGRKFAASLPAGTPPEGATR